MAADEAGLGQLRALGARGVPVVARGDTYVYAQDLGQVAALLEIDVDLRPLLPATELVRRCSALLAVATGMLDLIPAARLGDELPGRRRSYLALANHIVAIAEALLEVLDGAPFDGARAAAESDEMRNPGMLAADAQRLAVELEAALARIGNVTAHRVDTFYGRQPLHAVVERCTWHIAQHVRQVEMVLDIVGVPARPELPGALLQDLPLPLDVWDS